MKFLNFSKKTRKLMDRYVWEYEVSLYFNFYGDYFNVFYFDPSEKVYIEDHILRDKNGDAIETEKELVKWLKKELK